MSSCREEEVAEEEVKFLSWISSDNMTGQRTNKKHKKNMARKTVEKKKKKKGKKKDGGREGPSEGTEKKKKKKWGMEDRFLFVQSDTLEDARSTAGAPNLSQVTRVSKKKPKKRKVTFTLPTNFTGAKRPQFPTAAPKENSDVGNGEVVGQEDSPGGSENSQDLFITQKKFRTSPELESTEGTEESEELLQNSGLHKTAEEQVEHKGGRRGDIMLPTVRNPSSQTFRSSMNLEDERQVKFLKSSRAFPQSWSSASDPPPDRPRRTNSSTQTENFFTSELSSYLRFCRQRAAGSGLHSCGALDLRLSHRNRDQHQNSSSLWPTSSNQKDVKNEQQELELDQHLDLQSEFESKSADTTTSSEDSSAKLDLTQVRPVQTRLNESFFFRNKGEPATERPESPLMKMPLVPNLNSRKRR